MPGFVEVETGLLRDILEQLQELNKKFTSAEVFSGRMDERLQNIEKVAATTATYERRIAELESHARNNAQAIDLMWKRITAIIALAGILAATFGPHIAWK